MLKIDSAIGLYGTLSYLVAGLAIAAVFSRLLAGMLYDVSRLAPSPTSRSLLAYWPLPPSLRRSPPPALHISIRWKSYATNRYSRSPAGRALA